MLLRRKLAAVVAAPFVLICAPAVGAAPLSLADPGAFVAELTDMGYAPDAIADPAEPLTTIKVAGETYSIAFGGCENGKNCRYLVLLGSFVDIKNPPAKWVAAKNAEYDYIKVWVSASKQLTYSTGLLAQGLSRENFRAAVELFVDSSNQLAADAVEDKLVK